MNYKKDSPGVYLPPPFFYVLTFLLALFIQKRIPLASALFQQKAVKIAGFIFLAAALIFLVRSLQQFFKSKNTVITAKPASSLQTTGIYNITRNPMYIGLAIVYLAISCFIGNWWNIILLPLLLLVVQEYIIKREERYLERRFGSIYLEYKAKVRRWL